jgi:hypothetical protein
MDWCIVEIAFRMLETFLTYDEGMGARDEKVLFIFLKDCYCSLCCVVDLLERIWVSSRT